LKVKNKKKIQLKKKTMKKRRFEWTRAKPLNPWKRKVKKKASKPTPN
jgi:hypothetical protein